MPLNVVMHAFACRFGHELGAQLRLKLHHENSFFRHGLRYIQIIFHIKLFYFTKLL